MTKGYIQKITQKGFAKKYHRWIAFLGDDERGTVFSKDGMFVGEFTQEDILHVARVFHNRDDAVEYITDARYNYSFGGELPSFKAYGATEQGWKSRPRVTTSA